MKSRKFIVSLLLIFTTLSAFPCSWGYFNPKYHYLFYTGYDGDYTEFYGATQWKKVQDDRFKKENILFWYNYTNKKISKSAIETAIYSQYISNDNAFFQFLKQQKDSVALQYWGWVTTGDPEYSRWMMSAWYYPERQELNPLSNKDLQLLTSCKSRDIQNRYLLQFLRRSFYLEDYETCISLWKKYGQQVPNSALRTQCLNYYGGALKRTERETDAAEVYASIGYFDVYLHYNVNVLRSMYSRNPNSKNLEFVIQQFVNQYLDKPKKEQSDAFSSLVSEVIRDGKSNNPALWKSAEAAIAHIDNKTILASQLIHEADSLKGTKAVKENIRMLRLIINAANNLKGNAYDAALLPDLQWLTESINKDIRSGHLCEYDYEEDGVYVYDNTFSKEIHRVKMFRRAILLGIVPHYKQTNEVYKAIAYLNLYNETLCGDKKKRAKARKGWQRKDFNPYDYNHYTYNMDYWTRLFTFMENVKINDIQQYVKYLQGEKLTESDKFLYKNSYTDPDFFNELIATKFMRDEQYDSAIIYLQKISDKFLTTQNIRFYLTGLDCDNPFTEEWITKKELCGKYGLSYNPAQHYRQKPGKLQFCLLMKRLQQEIATEKNPESLARLQYAYTIGLYNSKLGKSWALTSYHNGQENIYGDEENDFNGMFYDPKNNRKLTESISKQIVGYLDKIETTTKDKMLRDKCYCIRYQLVDDENSNWWRDYYDYADENDDENWFDKIERIIREKYEKVAQHIRKRDKQMKREDLQNTFCDKQNNWE